MTLDGAVRTNYINCPDIMKKTEKIEIRIDSELKEKFNQYAKSKNKKISVLLREYIEECCKNV